MQIRKLILATALGLVLGVSVTTAQSMKPIRIEVNTLFGPQVEYAIPLESMTIAPRAYGSYTGDSTPAFLGGGVVLYPLSVAGLGLYGTLQYEVQLPTPKSEDQAQSQNLRLDAGYRFLFWDIATLAIEAGARYRTYTSVGDAKDPALRVDFCVSLGVAL